MNSNKAEVRVDETRVREIPQPEFTKHWRPYSHGTVVDIVNEAMKELKLKVVHKQFSLSADGMRMVGAYGIDTEKKKGSPKHQIYQAVVFRNSMDKTQSIGVAGGTDCWVCENLMVWGKYVEFRKHNATLDEKEMKVVVLRGIESLKPQLDQTLQFHKAMREIKLTERETMALAYEAIQDRIVSHQKLPVFHNMLFGENHSYDPTELFGFHGACTELMRDMDMTSIAESSFSDKQTKLNRMVINHFGDRLPKIEGVEIG
jgi:hypothetical protein